MGKKAKKERKKERRAEEEAAQAAEVAALARRQNIFRAFVIALPIVTVGLALSA
jgi:hypothetical protein